MATHFDSITDENVQADHILKLPDNTNYPAIPSELSCAARLKDGGRLTTVGKYRLPIDTGKSFYFRDGGKLMLHLAFRSEDGFSVEEHLEKTDGYPLVSSEYKFINVSDAAGDPVWLLPLETMDSAFWSPRPTAEKVQFMKWFEKFSDPVPQTSFDIEITPEVCGISVICTVEDDMK